MLSTRNKHGRAATIKNGARISLRRSPTDVVSSPLVHETHQTKAWFHSLLTQWREAWSVALPNIREHVCNGLQYLEAPLQATIYIRADSTLPIQASAIWLVRDPTKPDGELKVVILDETSVCGCGDAIARGYLEQLWITMCANWTPGRPPDPPLKPWSISARRIDDSTVLWYFPGVPAALDVDKLVDFSFREDPPIPDVEPPTLPKHLHALGMARERTGLQRWLTISAPDLFAELGIHGAWWCALNIPRCSVFGDSHDGDVDLIAGPLEFSVTEAEWAYRVERKGRDRPLDTPRGTILHTAVLRACAEGRILWPPRMDTVVACEVKASWFDPTREKWKATHVGEAQRIHGQLKVLLAHGIDRVAFLHMGSAKPRVTKFNPWIQAATDSAAALERLPAIFDPADLLPCGYYRVVAGAVSHKSEELAGAGASMQVLQAALSNENRTRASQAWRKTLQDRLAACPHPMWPEVYVSVCSSCGKWNLSHLTEGHCSCAATLPIESNGIR